MGISVWRQPPPQASLRERVAGWRARNWRRAILAWFVLTLAIMAVPVVPPTVAAVIAAGIPVLLVALP
jgi:amino acid permease